MIRNRILLKTFAVFFLLEMLSSVVAPAVSWALTAGPTAPEATSFEPVDTTDMVNLATGDLAYNIPLLEVPGPSGGYPLSLSYHAGIQPNEDASWVGLGWTLNPGSIARNVNGFADDQLNQPNSARYFWAGGSTETYSIGVSVGIAETPASVNAGLSFSQDTYMGFGVGLNVGVGYNFQGSGVGVGASIGVSPYGNHYYGSAGLNLSAPIGGGERSATGLSAGVGISTNFESVGFYGTAGISANYENGSNQDNASLLGATISSNNKRVSANVSVAGASVSNNSQSGRLNTNSSGFDIPIPVWYGVWVNHGYSYQRYWIDELDKSTVNGSLYFPDNAAQLTSHYFDDKAFDTYSLVDNQAEGGIVNNQNPDKVLGGSFPGVDNYLVNAQGISGYMRPYYYQKHLRKRNNYHINGSGDKEYETIQYDIAKQNPEKNFRPEFRFINDFSNRFEFSSGQINLNPPNGDNLPLQYNFSNGSDLRIGEEGSNSYTSNDIQGASHIDWLTNADIISKSARMISSGFMETVSSGFIRSTPEDENDDANIGGFIIANESGVKYHFGLPAYSQEEYTYSENKKGTETFNEFYKGGKYAYTWYLTGITGPDYVDRGPDGTADGKFNEYDWGYWVEFEYGKWTDQYAWRNPSEGMNADLDNNFQNFSTGIKEIYYLDAIRTKTHTALFFKDIRHDGKSDIQYLRNVNSFSETYDKNELDGPSHTVDLAPPMNASHKEEYPTDIRTGGFIPKASTCSCTKTIQIDCHSCGRSNFIVYSDKGVATYTPKPTSTLQLKSIVLIDNATLKNIPLSKLGGEHYAQQTNLDWTIATNVGTTYLKDQCAFPDAIDHHLYQNVYDIYDMNNANIKNSALRIIELGTDYSLSPGTSNSFDFSVLNGTTPSTDDNSYPKFGKLTLTGLSFLGKAGLNLIPPMKFRYDQEKPLRGSGEVTHSTFFTNYTLTSANSGLQAGDIVKITQGGKDFYALVTDVTGVEDDYYKLKILGKDLPASGTINWQQTKNPPYDKDFYDMWGLYKSDYTVFEDNRNIERLPSNESVQNVDVWSLRSVVTSLGATINIEYEPDSYNKVALVLRNLFRIKDVERPAPNTFKIFFHEDVDLTKYFKKDEIIFCSGIGFQDNLKEVKVGGQTCQLQGDIDGLYFPRFKTNNAKVIDVNSDYLLIEDQVLEEKLYNSVTHDTKLVCCRQNIDCTSTNYSPQETDLFYEGYVKAIIGGYVVNNINVSSAVKGGGLRVKEIAIESGFTVKSTKYTYSNGCTSFEPFIYLPPKKTYPSNFDDSYNPIADIDLVSDLAGELSKLLSISREIPPPGVIYERVDIAESITKNGIELPLSQHAQYEFEVYQDEVSIAYNNDQVTSSDFPKKRYDNIVDYSKKETRNVMLKDFTSRIGNVKSITLYEGEDKIISKTTNSYLHDVYSDYDDYATQLSSRFNSQGVIEETFSDARFVSRKDTDFSLQGVISTREQYPVIQIGQTTTNYKTGITTETKNLAFDYYSGSVTQTLSTDGFGNSYLTETIPAYRKYSGMGLAVNGGKNMLTQEAASYAYKVDPANSHTKLGLASASVQTWSDNIPVLPPGQSVSPTYTQAGIWRKKASYSFVGDNTEATSADGFYSLTAHPLPTFTWWDGTTDPDGGWQKNGEITLYDVQSHALEASDINTHYAATKLDFDQTRVLVSGANCTYQQLAYSGAEEQPRNDQFNLPSFGGNVYCSGTWTSDRAHTGTYSVKANAGSPGFTYFPRSTSSTYVVSFWSSQPHAVVKYQAGSSTPVSAPVTTRGQAGNWYLLEARVSGVGGYDQVKIWNEASGTTTYFDDFRIHPLEAAVTSYVYNQWGELSHILDNNNLYTEYRYDGMGRLKETYKESFQTGYGTNGISKVSTIDYNYGENSPYLISITASKTGGPGSISASLNVRQGDDAVFQVQETCPNPHFDHLYIDTKEVAMTSSSPLKLADGTDVVIQGGTVTFKNVQSTHTLQAHFYTTTTGTGVVQCVERIQPDGTVCYGDSYQYAYYDTCGLLGAWTACTYSTIPIALKQYAQNCCPLNTTSSATASPTERQAPPPTGSCGTCDYFPN